MRPVGDELFPIWSNVKIRCILKGFKGKSLLPLRLRYRQKDSNMTSTKTSKALLAMLLTVPFVAAHSANAKSSHQAWLEAQKIDIEPTLSVQETVVPLDQIPPEMRPLPSSPSYGTMPAPNAAPPAPPAPAPGTPGATGSGSYVPTPPSTMPQNGAATPPSTTPYGGSGVSPR